MRVMTQQEVNIAIDWAATEGWNPGIYDVDRFYAADRTGFLIGLLGDEPIATISAVKYGESFGFIGFYIVKPEYRGKGYGIQIWNAALASLKDRNIGLDGVVAQQSNYKKSGFTLAYNNVRYQGNGGGNFPTDPRIVQLSTVPFEELCAYDEPFFPGNRAQFLKSWVNQPQGLALAILKNNKLAGYGVIRACLTGYKIGPLFADSSELAEQLFIALKSHASEDVPVFLDIPTVNAAAIDLVKRHSMTAVFETARMYTGKIPKLPISRLYGVTTFELG
ncbi:MAG: GNAT superfamily N-acetyltransferase [Cellvibrionaceae bacterium]|jgi:GNAT superfamily N-acetyltransferase